MKRFLLSILCCLLAVVSGYAEEYTYTFTSKQFTANETKTLGSVDWVLAGSGGYWGYDGTKGQQFGSGNAPYKSMTLSTSGIKGTIESIKINTSGAKDIKGSCIVTVGGNQFGDKITLTNTATDYTLTGSASGDIVLSYTQTSSKAIYIKSITVTYTPESEGGDEEGSENPETPVAPTTPTLTPSCNFDNAMNVAITNISEGATVYYTTDESTPSAFNGTEYSAPFEITTTTTVKVIAIKGELSSEVVSATYTKNEVPKDPENIEGGTVSFTASANGYSNATTVTEVKIGDYVTATFDIGTNPNQNIPIYYSSGTAIRCYGGNTFTITSTAGNITKIVLTYGSSDGSNSITTNVGNFVSPTWTGSSKSVIFTIGGTTGNRRIAGISVTYEGTNSGTPEVENVQAPVISCDKEEYAVGEEAIVTITTETEGATIYYSLDGSEPTNVYSGAITLTETTTIKAIAKKEGANNSPVTTKGIVFKEVVTLVNATVAEAIAAYKSGKTITANASIVGYIVGAADGGLNMKDNFSGTTTVKTNLLIADDPNETNVENCMPVELPSGDIRNALNLAENPGNYKKQIVLTGSVEAYFSVAGLKKTSAYEFVEDVWGSLYSPIAVEIPENVKVYIVTGENNGYVKLKKITGAVPATTGVIYNGEWNNKEAATSNVADVTGNLLEGSVYDDYVTEEAFVLAKVDGVVGFYKALMNQNEGTAFKNNAGKAYLPVSALPSSVQSTASLKFRFDNQTTGVEGVKVEAEGKKVIYDLSGRRVNDMTAPGLYIVNGKKVLVK